MSKRTQIMHFAPCPNCDTKIRFQKLPLVGDLLDCFECREPLEVVSLFPIKLDWGYLDTVVDWEHDSTPADSSVWITHYDDDWNDLLEGILA